MARTVLRGGRVYDPINGVDGELRDVWMQDGRIIAAPGNPDVRAEIIVDVTGMIIMPGRKKDSFNFTTSGVITPRSSARIGISTNWRNSELKKCSAGPLTHLP